jgi:hypothetical protein
MSKKPKYSAKEIELALRESAGLQYIAATKLKCAPSTVTNYVKRNKHLQRVVEECREGVLDLAEGKILEKIRDGDIAAIIFFLKTKGKNRGYTERLDPNNPDGKPLPSVIETPAPIENDDAWEAKYKPKSG